MKKIFLILLCLISSISSTVSGDGSTGSTECDDCAIVIKMRKDGTGFVVIDGDEKKLKSAVITLDLLNDVFQEDLFINFEADELSIMVQSPVGEETNGRPLVDVTETFIGSKEKTKRH